MHPDFWKGRRVLVTGHTGFKGSWLSLWLHHLGAQVTGFALDPETDPSLFERADVGGLIASVIGDVRDPKALREVMAESQPEVVLHLAAQALVRTSYDDPAATFDTNVMGTVHLFDAVRSVDSVRSVVIVTSDKCYENREWDWGYRENEAMGGHDPYSASKGCAEIVTSSLRRSFFSDGPTAVASGRAGNVIGGGDWSLDRLIPDIVRAFSADEPVIIRRPAAVRPWQHVLEPLSGYLLLAERLATEGQSVAEGWNFGPSDADAQPVSWMTERMAERWGEETRWSVEESGPHEAGLLKLDCSKARGRLGWTPQLDLGTTLDWLVDWYRSELDGESARDLCMQQIAEYQRRVMA